MNQFPVSSLRFPADPRGMVLPEARNREPQTPVKCFLPWLTAIFLTVSLLLTNYSYAAPDPDVQLDASRTGPRVVEEQTANGIVRDYEAAWKALDEALEQNRPSLLGDLWTGFARQKWAEAIEQQKHSGVRVRYTVGQHRLTGIFYSPEGSALELRDAAQMEMQILDGETVVHSEPVTTEFLVVMTPTSDHWQVRMLQQVQ